MEMTDEEAPKLSRTEIRKQKLAEYLAAKGRLKPPNPKPYLKSSALPVKPREAVQKSHTSWTGKENSVSSTTAAKKHVTKDNTLLEKDLRTHLKSHFTHPACLPLQPTASQTAPQQARAHYKGTVCGVRNSSVKEQQKKRAVHTHGIINKQQKTFKKGPVSVSGAAQPPSKPLINTCTSIVNADLQKRHVFKIGSEKALLKYPRTKEQLSNPGLSHTDTKSLSSKQATLTQKPTNGNNNASNMHIDPKKPLNRFSGATSERSAKTQTASRLSNKVGNKPTVTHTQRSVPVVIRQQASLLSTKSENTWRSTTESVAGDKKAAPHQQQRCPTKNTNHAPVPQTLPWPIRTPSQTRGPTLSKIPKSAFNPGTDGARTVPLDGRKKTTNAQEERLRKLKEWRESKGITYKRPPMPVQPMRRKTTALPPQGYWSAMEQEDEVHGFVWAVDQSLNDCIRLLQQGCPAAQVRDVLSRVPVAQKFAKYWICQVRLMEQEGNLDVLPTFEEAVRVVREPVDELRSVVFEILKKKEARDLSSETAKDGGSDENSDENSRQSFSVCTPKPVGALIRGEKRDSSVIKYKITATPGGKRSQQKPGRVNGQELRFFTPVRRSSRIEKSAAHYPAVLQEHDPCVASLRELLAEGESHSEIPCTTETPTSPLYVYRENEALKELVQVQLVYE